MFLYSYNHYTLYFYIINTFKKYRAHNIVILIIHIILNIKKNASKIAAHFCAATLLF